MHAAFDVIFMCDFVEHVRDPLGVLNRAATMLRPGGQLVLTTPDTGSASWHLMGRAWPHYKPEHLFYFDRRNVSQILGRAGFAVTQSGRAIKVLDLNYVRHQFLAYPRPFVATTLKVLARLGGPQWERRPRSLSLGEMVVSAIKD